MITSRTRECKTKSQTSPPGSRRRRGLRPRALEGLERRHLLSATVYPVTDITDNFGDIHSLAGAVDAANTNANPAGSVIEFELGSSPTTISLTNNTLLVQPTEPLTIEGPGAGLLTITANNSWRVFDCASGDTTISGLTITGGVAQQDANGRFYGGGVWNEKASTLDLEHCTIAGNAAQTGGGGIADFGNLTLDGCTIKQDSSIGSGAGVFNGTTGSALIEGGSTITGNSAAASGGGLYNQSTTMFEVTGCTISGDTANNGGGLYNTGTAIVSGSTVSGNSAQNGGGMYNTGTATIEPGSTISGNTAGSVGGGLVNTGQAQLDGCTISGNSATTGGVNNGEGAGLFVSSGQSTTLVECTISGNSAQSGSGLFVVPNNPGQVSLTHCTMAENSAIAVAALFAPLGPVSLTDTIIADNTGSGGGASDIVGSQVTGSYNLIGTGGSGAIPNGSNGNIVLASLTGLGLAPLAYYNPFRGGVETIALLPGSPALGTGTPVSGITTDERGDPIGSSVDIGAFQSQGFTIAMEPGGSPQVAAVGTAFTEPLAVTVKANFFWEPVAGGVVTFAAIPGATGASATLSAATAVVGPSGVASITATANSTLGSYTVSASAAGATAPVDFDLKNLALATVTLSVSTGSPMYGKPVTLVATVTGAGTPTGMVTFLDGGTTLGTAPLNASGRATLTISDLPVGADSITAAYGGDTNFGSGTSAPESVAVSRDVTRVVLVPRPVFKKKKEVAIDLVAEIEPMYPGAVAATGTVRYLIKKRTLGMATVTAGKATLMVKPPTVRPKTITVVYSGDVDYTPSTMGPTVKTTKAIQVRQAGLKRA